MRDLLENLLKIKLIESSGGIARRWIEIQQGQYIPFVHSETKETYQLEDIIILPPDPNLVYEDEPELKGSDRLSQEILNVTESIGSKNVSTFGLRHGKSAIIVIMKNDVTSDQYIFVRKTSSKRSLGPNAVFWQTSQFAKDTGLWAQTPQMKKAMLPIEPTDFITAGTIYSINQLIAAVAVGANKNKLPVELKLGLPKLLTNVLNYKKTPVPDLAQFQSAIEVKLSELAAPIALQTGNFTEGNYKEVEDGILKPLGTSWVKATAVSFPPIGEKLIDAMIHFGNEKIDISVKDSSGGASPSIATIADTLQSTEFSPAVRSIYKEQIQAIELLNSKTAINGPLDLAESYGWITTSDRKFLASIYKKGIKEVDALPENWQRILDTVPYNTDKSHPEYQLGFHLLAMIAKSVAIKLNENPKLITDFFKAVLSKSSLVQVYAKTETDKDGGLFFNKFKIVWPPIFDGIIKVDGDSYTARTPPQRKISFRFGTVKTISTTSDATKKPKGQPLDTRPAAAKKLRQKHGYDKDTSGSTRDTR